MLRRRAPATLGGRLVVDREERSRQRMLSSRRRFVALGTVAPACAEAAPAVFGLRLPVAVGIP